MNAFIGDLVVSCLPFTLTLSRLSIVPLTFPLLLFSLLKPRLGHLHVRRYVRYKRVRRPSTLPPAASLIASIIIPEFRANPLEPAPSPLA